MDSLLIFLDILLLTSRTANQTIGDTFIGYIVSKDQTNRKGSRSRHLPVLMVDITERRIRCSVFRIAIPVSLSTPSLLLQYLESYYSSYQDLFTVAYFHQFMVILNPH